MRTIRQSWRIGAALLLAAAGLVLSGEPVSCLAQGSSCSRTCLDQYNQCRISTKGSPTCDAQYQACLQNCVNGHRR